MTDEIKRDPQGRPLDSDGNPIPPANPEKPEAPEVDVDVEVKPAK